MQVGSPPSGNIQTLHYRVVQLYKYVIQVYRSNKPATINKMLQAKASVIVLREDRGSKQQHDRNKIQVIRWGGREGGRHRWEGARIFWCEIQSNLSTSLLSRISELQVICCNEHSQAIKYVSDRNTQPHTHGTTNIGIRTSDLIEFLFSPPGHSSSSVAKHRRKQSSWDNHNEAARLMSMSKRSHSKAATYSRTSTKYSELQCSNTVQDVCT